MKLIDGDELLEILWRSDVSSREKIDEIVRSQPEIKDIKKIIAKCVKLNNDGWDSYTELELGGIYEVDHANVDRTHTDVYLKGMTGSFNSVCFKFYKDGQEIDIVREYIDSYYRKYKRK